MFYFEDVIAEIEANLRGEIDIDALARRVGMSVYEFRRIFSFVTKMPLGEYIRKRRLSLAAMELYHSEQSIAEFAKQYGYDSPSSFSRAFKEFHGVSPYEVQNENASFQLLTKISAQITVCGCRDISYRLLECDAFTVSGKESTSHLCDTECCEDAWSAFYAWEGAQEIEATAEAVYAVYQNERDCVRCLIGAKGASYPDCVTIPHSLWACFRLRGTDDATVNAFYHNILNEYLASGGVERDTQLPNIEIFPTDMTAPDFEWEIRIPVKRSGTYGRT